MKAAKLVMAAATMCGAAGVFGVDAYIYDTAGGTANLGAETQIDKPAADQRFIVCQGTVNINEGASIKVGGNTSNICNYIGVDRNNATAVVNIDGGTLWCTTEGGGSGYLAVGGNNYTLTAVLNLNSGTLKVDGRVRSSTMWNSMSGASCSGAVNINAGEADVNEFFVGTDADSTGSSSLKLAGGVLKVNLLSIRSYNNQTFEWGSGTLEAKKENVFQLYQYYSYSNTRSLSITGAPAVFNTAGFAQTIPAGFTGTGTLSITGGGATTFDADSVTYSLALDGATLALAKNGRFATAGKLSLGTGSKISCDMTLHSAYRIEAAGGIELPEGAVAQDFVEAADGSAVAATLTDGGKTILVGYAAGDIVKAVWKGAAGASGASSESWDCFDAAGAAVANAVPGAKTTVVFGGDFAPSIPAAAPISCLAVEFAAGARIAADSDMAGLAAVSPYAGALDLNGHRLRIGAAQLPLLAGMTSVTDSAADGGGAIALFVAEGESVDIAQEFTTRKIETIIADNVKLVKTGAGALVATKLAVGDNDKAEIVQEAGSVTLSAAADSQIGGCLGGAPGEGSYTLNGGTLSVNYNFMMGSYGKGRMVQTGGEMVVPNNWFVIGRWGGGTGDFSISGGKAYTSTQGIIVGEDGTGKMTVSGTGEVTSKSEFRIASNAGGRGEMFMDGGRLNAQNNLQVGRYGIGSMTQSGGSITCAQWFCLGRFPNSVGTYNMTGGTYESTGQPLLIAEEGFGTFDLSGNGIATANKGVNIAHQATGSGYLRVHDGGTLVTPYIRRIAGNGTMEFDGGKVVALGNGANLLDFFRGAESVVVGPGGMTLDTGNNTVYATGLDARDAKGPIVKTGTGTLVFDELPNTEKLSVQAGTLRVATGGKPELVHRWSFNGDYADSVGGSDGTVIGSNIVFTNESTAVYMYGDGNGTGSLNLGTGIVPDGAVTIEIWATRIGSRSWSRVFDYAQDTYRYLMMAWQNSTNTGTDVVEVNNGVGNTAKKTTANNTMAGYAAATPYHIAITIRPNPDGSSSLRWSRRPAGTARADKWGTMVVADWKPSKLVDPKFFLGHSIFSGDLDANAIYDEVRIWRGALSDEELGENSVAGPDVLLGDGGRTVLAAAATDEIKANDYLLHRWNFNGNIKDLVGSKDAVFKGTTPPDYLGGNKVRLTGGGRGRSWIDLGSDIIPAELGDAPFTIECWVTQREQRNWCQAFAFGWNGRNDDNVAGGTSGFIVTMRRGDSNNALSFNPCGAQETANISVTPSAIAANVEYHIAATVTPSGDGNSATIGIYVFDARTGAKVGSLTKQLTNWTTSKIVQNNFRLGHSWWNDYDLMADYDEVRVWAAALSEEQLSMNAALGPDVLPTIAKRHSLTRLNVAQDAVVDLGGNTLSQAEVTGTGEIKNGTLNVTGRLMPGGDGTVGTLTLAADATVTGTLRLDVGDLVVCEGGLDLSKIDVEVANPSQLNGPFVFATSTEGGITGSVRSLDVKGCLVSVSKDGTRASIQRGGLTVFVR